MDEAEINEEYSRTKFRLDVDDPELECVTNLIYYGFLLINHANKSNRHQLSREFDKHYFTAIKFFESCATRGNTPQDRVALVKDSAAWVNDVKRWVRGGLFGRFEPNRIDYLYEQQGVLIARCKIMAFISLDEMKKKIVAVLDKQADLAKKDLTETKQNATPDKRRRVKPILCAISAVVIFLAALLTVFHYLGWLEPIKAIIYNMLPPK